MIKPEMEETWEVETAHQKFWRSLLNQNVDNIVRDREHLRSLRFNHELMKRYQKRFGHVFEERGLNLYQLVAESCDEDWEMQDEEKTNENVAPMEVKKVCNAVSLDHPRQIGVRSGKKEECELQLQTGDEGWEELVQAERQGLCGSARGGGPEAPEGGAKKKKVSERRVKKQHTVGLGNVEEGKIADKSKPAKKARVRKRPVLEAAKYKGIN